jgi:hypothetical protein
MNLCLIGKEPEFFGLFFFTVFSILYMDSADKMDNTGNDDGGTDNVDNGVHADSAGNILLHILDMIHMAIVVFHP